MSLIPLPYRIGLAALVLAIVGVYGYVKGRKDVRALWNAHTQAQAVEAARAKGEQDERERMWSEAMKTAGAKYDERAKMADGNFDAALNRLRNAYSSSARLRIPASAAGQCPEPSGPTASELLRQGETLAGILRDADRDRAALMACVSAWPR